MNRNHYQRRNAKIVPSHHPKPANPGVVMLTKAADQKVQKWCSEIAEALANEAIKGNASSTRLLVDLAEGAEWVKDPATVERVLSVVEAWMKEPKCDDAPGEMPAGVIAPEGVIAPTHQAAHAVYVN